MLRKPMRAIAVAAKTGRIGCVYLVSGILKDWQMSRKGAETEADAALTLRRWIVKYDPDTVISENPDSAGNKGDKQKGILGAWARIAEDTPLLNMLVVRAQKYQNIYVEAEQLAKKYPQIKNEVPTKPPIWMPEPRKTVLFEALSMADRVLAEQ